VAISQSELSKKRRKAAWALVGGAGTTGASAVVPTPGLEIPKQAVIGATDAVLLATIYNFYYEESIESQDLKNMLLEMGLIGSASVVTAYGSVKAAEGAIHEVLNWVPGLGWIAKGFITGSVTLSVGTLWLLACDAGVRNGISPVEAVKRGLAFTFA
jgi:hypothetical protein